MSNMIERLKAKREKTIKIREEENKKRQNLDIDQFLKDSLKVENAADGMVILITENSVEKRLSPKGISHRKVVQDMLDEMYDKHIDLSEVEFDYGDAIPAEYNCIFIRMASILNGATVVYYPDICNEYQIKELEKINEQIKSFNNSKMYIEYRNQTDFPNKDLDELIQIIKSNQENMNPIKK